MRLIDADYADKLAKDLFKGQIGITFYQATHAMLESIKPIDAVPVVRCHECKFGEPMGRQGVACHNPAGLKCLGSGKRFCSYGERKDGEK